MVKGSSVAPVLVWALWLSILTLFPFDFWAQAGGQHVAAMVLERGIARRGADVLLNAVLFLPLGIWVHGEAQRRARSLRSALCLAAASAALLSLTVELIQLFLPSRFPSLLDVVANAAGAVAGVHVHRAWAPRARAATARVRRRMSTATLFALMTGCSAAGLIGSAALQSHTRLTNWDESYPLVVGNERTESRPWRGRVYRIDLTDRSAPPASLRLFARGGAPVIPGVRVASFDFTGPAPYRDAAGSVPKLTWTGRPEWTDPGPVGVSEHAWLQTEGAAPQIARRLRESTAFTLRVVCASDDPHQIGPARIISNSIDPRHRNFTLGQTRRSLIIRVRTSHTGENATNPEFVVPGVFVDGGRRDILVTYDGATLRAAVAGSGRVFRFELTPGSRLAAAWFPDISARELERYELTYIALLFLPPGLLVGVFGRRSTGWVASSAAWVLGFALLLEGTLALVSGRLFDWSGVATTAAVGAFVFASAIVMTSGFGPTAHATLKRESPS